MRLVRPALIPFVFGCLASLLAALTGCTATHVGSPPSPATREAEAAREIRARIDGIRTSILAKQAEGIVAPGTADWSLTGPDGVTVNRADYLKRAEALFARVITIESLRTEVDRIEFPTPERARVEITQTMVRTERNVDTGAPTRLWLRYREEHTWLRTSDGWRVQRVVFLGTPERRVLRPDEKP